MWRCGYAAMWLCGYVAMWLSGYVASGSPTPHLDDKTSFCFDFRKMRMKTAECVTCVSRHLGHLASTRLRLRSSPPQMGRTMRSVDLKGSFLNVAFVYRFFYGGKSIVKGPGHHICDGSRPPACPPSPHRFTSRESPNNFQILQSPRIPTSTKRMPTTCSKGSSDIMLKVVSIHFGFSHRTDQQYMPKQLSKSVILLTSLPLWIS